MKFLYKNISICLLVSLIFIMSCDDDALENVGITDFSTDQAGSFVSIETDATSVQEGGDVTVTLAVPNPIGADVAVGVSIASGTMELGTDFTIDAGDLTFNGLNGTGTIVFDITSGGADEITFDIDFPFDNVVETDGESLTITLTSASAANGTQMDLGDPTSNPGGDPVTSISVTVADPTIGVSFGAFSPTREELFENDTLIIPVDFSTEFTGETVQVNYSVNATSGVAFTNLSGGSITSPTDSTINLVILPDLVREVNLDTLSITIETLVASAGTNAAVSGDSTIQFFISDNLSTVALVPSILDTTDVVDPVANIATTFLYEVDMGTAANADVTVNYTLSSAIAGVTDVTAGTLLIAQGEESSNIVLSVDPSVFANATDQFTTLTLNSITTTSEEVSLSVASVDVTTVLRFNGSN